MASEKFHAGSRIPCRLCAGDSLFWGTMRLLARHEVSYFLCEACGSLETEPPYWLDEAYDVTGIGDDLGAAQRTIDLTLKCSALLSQMGLPAGAECVDFGGGIGLFTRMMRDRGYNFRSYDRYARPFFSDRYSLTSIEGRSPAVVTAFEVVEHFPDPAEDLKQLFETRPALVLVTTELFTGQGLDWPYLADGTGQHVFFYSPKAMNQIARRFQYSLIPVGGLFVFMGAAEAERFGIDPSQAMNRLRELSRNNLLMRLALAQFALHQQAPYDHVLRDVEAGSPCGESWPQDDGQGNKRV